MTHLFTSTSEQSRETSSIVEQNHQHVLVVQGESRGDVVMLTPALRALRQALPGAQISLLTSTAGSQVAPLLPWLDDVLINSTIERHETGLHLFDPRGDVEFVEQLRSRNFTLALIFTSFSQSPLPAAHACYMAGIPYRVGLARNTQGSVLSHPLTPPADDLHQVDRNLYLLEGLGISGASPETELEIPLEIDRQANELLSRVGLKPNIPYIVLAPEAVGVGSQYDPARFATVAHVLAAQTELQLVVVGSVEEAKSLWPLQQLAEENLYGNMYSLVEKASLPVQAAVIRRASLTISNNSVSMHFADAFGCPMVILYSETDIVSQWMPRNTPARLLRRPAICARCNKIDCHYGMNCPDVRPEEVAIAALEMLAAQTYAQPTYQGILRHKIETETG
jgi:ADP-heptose:LPS heptosyltransferase